jgi:gas vesicle protein
MEGLIIGFIVMALGALFSQKKTKEETERQGKPNQAQTARQRNLKRAEDYAKEIYGELQSQMKDQPERTKQIARKVQETVESRPNREPHSKTSAKESAGRLSAHQSHSAAEAKTRPDSGKLFPLENDDLKKSIILAEILLPPKSKR